MEREELIQSARKLYNNPWPNDALKKALEENFPELKDSEDERIRKGLISHLKELREWKVGTTSPIKVKEHYDAWIAYLEKQKDASKAIAAIERIDKYIDERVVNAHDMKDSNPDKKYYCGWDDALAEMSRILQDVYSNEKQKENPKSADYIPSDCVSNAKCEDRWHKVTDSLPDNGRLVLAKDCLGNVLLARYDGENWEVNVYDNEDYYCHNIISKWCEIPSEKQKEPTEELSIRLNGLMQEYVKAGKDEEEQEHRLKCYQLFWDALGDSEFFKQKEQKPIKVLYIPKFRKGDTVISTKNPRLTYQILDVGNINELGNPEYKVEIFTDGESDEPRNIKYIEVAKMDDWGNHMPAWAPTEEQMEALMLAIEGKCPAPTSYLSRRLEDLYEGLAYTYGIECELCDKQKLAEWSKEDEHRRTDAIYFLESAKSHYADTSEIEKTVLWLKSISSNLKKRNEDIAKLCSNEWSEEDEKILNELLDYCNTTNATWYNWLKSLRPQPHWKPSEEQMKALKQDAEWKKYSNPILFSLFQDLKSL